MMLEELISNESSLDISSFFDYEESLSCLRFIYFNYPITLTKRFNFNITASKDILVL